MQASGPGSVTAPCCSTDATLFKLLPLEPIFTAPIERRDLPPVEARHAGLHFVADPGLEVGEVPVALGKLRQQVPVQLQLCGRVDRVETVLFVDRLAQHQAPAVVALLEEVVESARADHVADDAIDACAPPNRHLGLAEAAGPGDADPP